VLALQAQLTNAPSLSVVENMKRELRILKRLEYNAGDADSEQDPELTTSGDGDEIVGDLEAVLVAKLRRTEAELVKERNSKTKISQKCDDLSDQLSKLEMGKVEADKLIYSLESDLQKAITTPAVGTLVSPTSGSFDVMHFPVAPGDPNVLQQIIDPTSPGVSTAVVSKPAPPKPSSKTASEKANDDHSVATIVMAQRDRLRARCDALEAERDSFKMELQVQVQSAESLKVDNTKLYEKVRYLQNFGNKPSSSASLGAGSSTLHQRRGGGDVDLDLEALEQRYEASVDPFRQFGRTERQRKLKEMSPMERIVFIVSKTVLSSKEMRTALFFYVFGMHLLVFITTYHWSHELGCHDLIFQSSDSFAHMHGGVPLPETRGLLLEPPAGSVVDGGPIIDPLKGNPPEETKTKKSEETKKKKKKKTKKIEEKAA
jgi:homeobox protein cut-like